MNKIDLLLKDSRDWDEEKALNYLTAQCEADEYAVLVSAVNGWGLGRILELVSQTIAQAKQPVFSHFFLVMMEAVRL